MEKKIKIGFLLNKITTEQFAIIESFYKDNEEVQYNFGLHFGFDKLLLFSLNSIFSKMEILF